MNLLIEERTKTTRVEIPSKFDLALGARAEPRASEFFISREPALTNKNWKLYAAQHYDNIQCIGDEEFECDLKRIKYIKKALTRYRTNGEICERLVLNHVIVLSNVFKPIPLSRMLFLKMEDQLSYIKPFLVMLNVLPRKVLDVNGQNWNTDDVPMDEGIVRLLRKI